MNSITCSWCHTINDDRQRWCKTCGHSAWLCRLDCDCRKCLGVLFAGELTTILPTPDSGEPSGPVGATPTHTHENSAHEPHT